MKIFTRYQEITKLKKERIEKIDAMEKRLVGKDKEDIDNIILYIVSKHTGEENESKIIIEVLEIVEEGLNRGLGIDEILGDDHKAFVDEIALSYQRNYWYLLGILSIVGALYFMYVTVLAIPNFVRTGNLWITVSGGSMFLTFFYMFVATAIVDCIVSSTYSKIPVKKILLWMIPVLVSLVLTILFWNVVLFQVHLVVALLLILAGVAVYKIC